jgi:hypothetical protein
MADSEAAGGVRLSLGCRAALVRIPSDRAGAAALDDGAVGRRDEVDEGEDDVDEGEEVEEVIGERRGRLAVVVVNTRLLRC